MAKLVVSWSGGKDSCFACYKAISDGFDVAVLLNLVNEYGKSFHGIDSNLICAQSRAVEIPIIQRKVTWTTYEQGFRKVIGELKQSGIDGVVFGDISLKEHKEWIKRVCGELCVKPYLPLWNNDSEQILKDLIHKGFKAVIIRAKAALLGKEWVGHELDESFIDHLRNLRKKSSISMCGEFDEYHTFVVDGPFFKKQIKILDADRIFTNGYWFLNISRIELGEKYHRCQ
jgi:uncharacterized protein (TIGR00290 family)